MGAEFIAFHSTDLSGVVPDWVHLLPIGTFTGRDGRGPYTNADAAKVIAASIAHQRGADLPIDYDHQMVFARENGQPAIAAGWIKELRVFPNGIWGRVEWTAEAAQRIGARQYRYLSPMFTHDKGGAIIRLAGAGLVNMPNLELTSINSQQGTSMDLIAQLRALLGLPESADEAAVLEAVKAMAELSAIVRRAAKLPEATPFPSVLDTLKQRAANPDAPAGAGNGGKPAVHGAMPDHIPAGFVPVAALEHMAAQHNVMREQMLGREVERMVTDAMCDGKLPPALREWATAHAASDPEAFKQFAALMPQILTAGAVMTRSPPGERDPASGLTASQLAVCAAMGHAPKDYASTIKEAAR